MVPLHRLPTSEILSARVGVTDTNEYQLNTKSNFCKFLKKCENKVAQKRAKMTIFRKTKLKNFGFFD